MQRAGGNRQHGMLIQENGDSSEWLEQKCQETQNETEMIYSVKISLGHTDYNTAWILSQRQCRTIEKF